MKFFAYLALLSTASAADCTKDAAEVTAGTSYTEGTDANGDPAACDIPACAAGVTANTYESGVTAPCTPAAADPPACGDDATLYTCADAANNADCTVNADSSACTYSVVDNSGTPADCPADATLYTCADAANNADCTLNADSAACTYKAPDAGNTDTTPTTCSDPATDCTGDDMVCQTNEWGTVDDTKDGYTAELETSTKAGYPVVACATATACADAVKANDEAAETWYTITISCGATKLVAGFAALALASAM